MPDRFPVSLVIPTYNRGHLIEETLAAALEQSPAFAEIIVVDDASTDDTLERLDRYGSRIKVIRLAKGGVQKARNAGIAAAAMPHVALCDSDDLLDAGYTRAMARMLAQRPDVDIWYCNFATFTGDDVQQDKLSGAPAGFLAGAAHGPGYCTGIPDLYERVLRYQPFFPTGSLVRKDFYEAIGGYDPRFNGVGSEDFEFLLRAIGAGKLGCVTTPLAFVRKHDSNDSRDTLRALRGEVHILEHALAHHAIAARYRTGIVASIDKRRRDAFDIAYARGDFLAAQDTASHFNHPPTDSNFRIKNVISHFPPIMRDVVWRLSQAVN